MKATLPLALLLLSAPSLAQVGATTFWTADDVTLRLSRVTDDGTLLSSFHAGSVSGLSVDPGDRTLWAAKEGFNRIVNFDRSGAVLSWFPGTAYDPTATSPEGVAVDPLDGTLWIVDDVTLLVYHVERDGTLIDSFPTSAFDPGAWSPQELAIDPADSTLWITDNASASVYNVTAGGALIASFPTSVFEPAAINPQGISVDELNGTLWISDRGTHRIYNVERTGEWLASFDTDRFGSLNPTSVAYERPAVYTLGQADSFALIGGREMKLRRSGTRVLGDVALAAGGVQSFQNGRIEGAFIVDPEADNTNPHQVVITGGELSLDLGQALADARLASDTAATLPPTHTFNSIKKSRTIHGGPGTNVVQVNRIVLEDDEVLTLSGSPTSKFFLNVQGRLKLEDSRIRVAGGVLPGNVVINVVGEGAMVRIEDHSRVSGVVLAVDRVCRIKKQSVVRGAVITGRDVILHKGAEVVYTR